MGLDVSLYQFKDVDTEAILKLSQFAEEPWTSEEFKKWDAMPSSDRGPYDSEKGKAEWRQQLLAKARELRLPEKTIDDYTFGGIEISFPSTRHPEWPVGEWYTLSGVCLMMYEIAGHDLYSVFPEAKDVHAFLRPDWAAAKKRLKKILEALQKVVPARREEISGAADIFDGKLDQLEVMIETVDFVLNSGNPKEFLLYWSA